MNPEYLSALSICIWRHRIFDNSLQNFGMLSAA